MKIGFVSHCTFDSIEIGGSTYEQIGGPVCYGGVTARNLKFDVEVFTKFGPDFPQAECFTKNKISFSNALSDKLTTRFKIKIFNEERNLYVENRCDKIEHTPTNTDGLVISPVFDELSLNVLNEFKDNSNFVFLDPQGFLRRTNQENKIILEKIEVDLRKISAIKVNPDELFHLTGNNGIEGMKILQKKGVDHVIETDKREISLLVKDKMYSITLPNLELFDTTGIGDIFCSAFCCTILKEKDFLWAICFAGGAAQGALETKNVGIDKAPSKGAVETNAAYFYNMVKFKQI